MAVRNSEEKSRDYSGNNTAGINKIGGENNNEDLTMQMSGSTAYRHGYMG